MVPGSRHTGQPGKYIKAQSTDDNFIVRNITQALLCVCIIIMLRKYFNVSVSHLCTLQMAKLISQVNSIAIE